MNTNANRNTCDLSTGSINRTTPSPTGGDRWGVKKNETTRCECGSPKRRRESACSRCRRLDGTRPTEMGVISALRACSDPQTTRQIARDAGLKLATVQRWISRNAHSGRLVEVAPGLYALREDFRPSLVSSGNY